MIVFQQQISRLLQRKAPFLYPVMPVLAPVLATSLLSLLLGLLVVTITTLVVLTAYAGKAAMVLGDKLALLF